VTAPSVSVLETERQVSAAAERHREVLASKEAGGRPASGQHAADKAVGRSLQLMAFVLKRAAAAGVTVERLAELSAWTPEIVRQALERRPDQELAARVAPGHDPVAVARAAASFEAGRRVHALLEQVRADIDDDTWSPAASDLDDLRERLESDWRGWRRTLQRA
jgi:hypothetical protein